MEETPIKTITYSEDNDEKDKNTSRGKMAIVEENTIEMLNSSDSKLADISEIVYKDTNHNKSRSNIFDS
mgnify:CR=1 FL=1